MLLYHRCCPWNSASVLIALSRGRGGAGRTAGRILIRVHVWAVGGGCQSGWGRLLWVTNAIVTLALAVRGTVAGHRRGALRVGGGLTRSNPPYCHTRGGLPPFECIPPPPTPGPSLRTSLHVLLHHCSFADLRNHPGNAASYTEGRPPAQGADPTRDAAPYRDEAHDTIDCRDNPRPPSVRSVEGQGAGRSITKEETDRFETRGRGV